MLHNDNTPEPARFIGILFLFFVFSGLGEGTFWGGIYRFLPTQARTRLALFVYVNFECPTFAEEVFTPSL